MYQEIEAADGFVQVDAPQRLCPVLQKQTVTGDHKSHITIGKPPLISHV